MEILEDIVGWRNSFDEGWLKTYRETGEMNWRVYNRPHNKNAPASKGIDLSQSKLGLICSGGFYVPASQEPFDAEHDLGDYTMRLIPWDSDFDELAISHTHYDHTAANQDRQVLLPLRHLQEMVAQGKIGSVAQHAFSFSGYLPEADRTVHELAPLIVAAAKQEQLEAALLVPA